jgi:hypothetical protein
VTVERMLRLVAGAFVALSVALGALVHPGLAASVLGTSEDNVKTRLRRARMQLRRELERGPSADGRASLSPARNTSPPRA